MITKYGYGAAHCGALSFALLVACGGSGTGSKAASKPAKPADVASTYSIKAHLTVEGHPEQVPPVDLNSASAASGFKTQAVAGSSSGVRPLSLKQPGLRPQTTIGQGVDGGIDSEQQDSTLNNAPGWSLLYWAATACYTTSDPSQSITSFSSVTISSQPWLTTEFPVRNYYIFHDSQASAGGGADFNPDDQSCDVRLAMQETLLCAADHLAQLADSPGTVTWSGNDGSPGASTITVTIPPQRTQDVFIARDMALNALAHLARLDTKSRSKTEQSTCIKGYNDEAAAKLVPTDNLITTSSYFDPVRLTNASSGADFGAAAVRRLKRKAGVLIGAARLTKALVEGSVQDDISGAQQQLSSSTDYHSGARLAWGMEQAQSPYNTLRHALRTVYGRLEIGNEADAASPEGEPFQNPGSLTDWSPHDVTRDDPRCEWGEFQGNFFNRTGSGTAAIDQLTKIPGISARMTRSRRLRGRI
jgi:hypothetical protein